MGDNAIAYLRRGNWTIGSFSNKQSATVLSTGCRVIGPGNLSGEFAVHEDLAALPFAEQLEYSLIYGFIAGNYGGDCEVRGITMWKPAWFGVTSGWHRCYDVGFIAPWGANSNAFGPVGDPEDEDIFHVEHCFAWGGDDVVTADWFQKNGVIKNNLFSTTGGACFLMSYQQEYDWPYSSYSTLVEDNTAIACGDYFVEGTEGAGYPDDGEGGTIVQAWVDAPDGQTDYGSFNVTINNLYVDGDLMNSRLFDIGNRFYAWGTPLAKNGRVANWRIDNVVVQAVPAEKSKIRSLDWLNTPHDIQITNLRIAGTLVTVRNYTDYFYALGPYAYHIFLGDRAVTTDVNICNTALSYVGERDRVTSIDPVDGSEESRHCARAYTEAFEELLEMHTWSFATKKIELTVINADADDTDDPAWSYRYEIPEGMAEAIAVLPSEHTEDYVVADQRMPQNFHIKLSSEDDELRIYSNVEDAYLRYTVYVTDPNQCSRLFLAALTWLVAAKIAGTVVRGDSGEAIKNRCLAMFGKYLAEAKTKDARQRQVTSEPTAPWMAARHISQQNPWNSLARG
jgi:hypothetical protein